MQPLALPDCVPAAISVWQLALDLQAPLAPADLQLLSDEERARIGRLHHPADRMRAVAGRAALRRLLGAALSCAPQHLRFGAGQHGKPHLLGPQRLAFNVSHAGEYVLIALGGDGIDAVGVDVERRDPVADVAALAPYALTAQERQALEHEAQPAATFFDIWSAKEAALKALGVGVSEHLLQLGVQHRPGPGLQLRHRVAHWPALRGCQLPAPFQYSAALAWHTKD
ncbi:4'-phosphopantetheinyl transferase superfamily protein [Duganella sp.]|uniref:4'-phosphopantetheinyl transferase family protein n=1 Tax=Duganella sp. TaxID=1904440 RepID=UPI0031D38664